MQHLLAWPSFPSKIHVRIEHYHIIWYELVLYYNVSFSPFHWWHLRCNGTIPITCYRYADIIFVSSLTFSSELVVNFPRFGHWLAIAVPTTMPTARPAYHTILFTVLQYHRYIMPPWASGYHDIDRSKIVPDEDGRNGSGALLAVGANWICVPLLTTCLLYLFTH